MTPRISVITTVYNSESYIIQSVESILDQTFKDFEYIIVDDGSTDKTSALLQKLVSRDSRIILIANHTNLGRVNSLNTALGRSRGEFIALQDADDISLPDRFEKQCLFLANNPDHVLVGSNIIVMDEFENFISKPKRPTDDMGAKFSLLFRCTFANPSIMYRKNVIVENKIRYEENFIHAEDFRIITIISRFGKVHNLSSPLVKYRKHPSNNSVVNFDVLNSGSIVIVRENLAQLGVYVEADQVHRIRNLISSRGINKKFLYEDIKVIFRVIKKFHKKNNLVKNNEIQKTLKRMLKWLGKKNILKPKYMRLYLSILYFYNKEIFFRRN
ncbi:MAG: glycosyltransferase [Ignavibacteria bacterium]